MFPTTYFGHQSMYKAGVVVIAGLFALCMVTEQAYAQTAPELLDRSAQTLNGLSNDSTTKSVELGDFNQDGFEDLIVTRRESTAVVLINQEGVLTNRSADYLADSSNTSGANYAESFDANNDGFPDLALARPGTTGILLLNLGVDANGAWRGFDAGTVLPGVNNGLVVESGDINADGADDLFYIQVENQTNQLLINDGSGTFTQQSDRLGGLGALTRGHAVLLADVDTDSDIDVVYIESDLFLHVYYNDGQGNYADSRRHTFRNPDNFAYIFGAADFNGDGIFDYRQYSNPAPLAEISTGQFDNAGLPVYTVRQDAPMLRGNRKHGFVHMRDIDGDGDMDYVLSSMLRNFGGLRNTFEGMRTEMVINQGFNSGTFRTFVGDDWGREESMDMKIIDINLDGNMDLFVAHPNRYGVYMNSAPPKVVELGSLVSAPVESGLAVTLQAELVSGDRVSYQWDFGDGQSAVTDDPTVNHVYAAAGRYLVTLTAEGPFGSDQKTLRQRVHEPLAGTGRSSTTVALNESDNRLWVVNPDNNSVTVINGRTGELVAEIPVGLEPVSVWLAADNNLAYVVNKSHASVTVISTADLTVQRTEWLRYASRPHGLVVDPAGAYAYIAHEVTNEVRKYALPGFELAGQLVIGDNPRHLAMNAGGTRVYAPLFITAPQAGESTRAVSNTSGGLVRVIAASAFELLDTILLPNSTRDDTDVSARGIPNYLMAPALSPSGNMMLIPAKQDNIFRGSMRDGNAREHNMLVRGILPVVDLNSGVENIDNRHDFDNNSQPSAVVYGPTGNFLFVVHEASRLLEVMDVYSGDTIFSTEVGFAPRGLALSSDGSRLYVNNYLSRSVTAYDVSDLMNGVSDNIDLLFEAETVTNEILSDQVLEGKRIFHDSADAALSGQKYISCATCHSEMGHDGRTWDFSDAGEGLRNTIDLRGRAGTGHGNVHWTANFNEIHDFENDIREIFDGTGLLSDAQYEQTIGILDTNNPKAGLSDRLDALNAFVNSLIDFGLSPYRNNDGSLTPAAQSGKEVFRRANCAQCHSGDTFTDSPLERFHNIGTVDDDTGRRLGQALPGGGLDTPTLRGLWHGAPYLHDGSADTLAAAVQAHTAESVGFDVSTLSPGELVNLTEYLRQIDDIEPRATSVIDHDGDLIVNELDTDDDDDGVEDTLDAFPLDDTETTDSDNDGVGDNADVFPLDGSETLDSDSDGTGDNGDAFPLDATENADIDLDGIGDNADIDDDNDGVSDAAEGMVDTDGDGIPNYLDLDSDADTIPDVIEAAATPEPVAEPDEESVQEPVSIDENADGIIDDLLLQGTLQPKDSDLDGIADFLDLESSNAANDGAGPYDITGGTLSRLDINNDGRLLAADGEFTDSNNDGLDDRAGSQLSNSIVTGTGGCQLVAGRGAVDPVLYVLLVCALLSLCRRRRMATLPSV